MELLRERRTGDVYLRRCTLGGFFSALFGGQDKNLNSLIGTFNQAGSSSLGQGQKNQNTAGNFWNSIISGDSSKTAQALAPEISSEKKAVQQDQKTSAMFGNRSGGTAASNNAATDKVHSDITNLVGSLTNSSASSLASLGSAQVGEGSGLLSQEQGADAARMENWSNSILGLGLTKGSGFAEGLDLSGISGLVQKTSGGNRS